jgi:Fe-S oxidoreductase
MSASETGIREGSLQAPSRHPLDWRSTEFNDPAALEKELERVFDICHGCRRCFSLCNSFPTLFDAIDASPTLELDGVDKQVYWDVVDHCYLCDMCFMTKCPYVPPHPWNIDFPHLMLRAKHHQHRNGEHSFRDKLLSNTRGLGSIAGIPVIAEVVNAVNGSKAGRKLLEATLGVASTAPIPKFHSNTGSKRARKLAGKVTEVKATETTRGKIALFVTCSSTTASRSGWSTRKSAAACPNSSWATSTRSRSTRTSTFRS